MTESGGAVQIVEMDRDRIDDLLSRNNVGRIGYARGNHMDIQPVHYVYSDGWIYGRTSAGSKYQALGTTAYRWWPVVFEVDEVEDLFHWRSVIVRGGFYVISPDGAKDERETWDRALQLLRGLVPEALASDDPVPARTILFRIAVQEVTGRECTPGGYG